MRELLGLSVAALNLDGGNRRATLTDVHEINVFDYDAPKRICSPAAPGVSAKWKAAGC